MSELKYDAFISYRHGGIDQYVAEQVHKRLETFKLPTNILKEKKKNGEKTKIERVFRDQEELPLSDNLEDEIVKALENSDNLIVICSPRFQDSMWCRKEVETFIKLHGRKHIYAVLVEGEPKESFPKELTYNEKGELVEPLAADFRAKNKRELNKKMDIEILRLVAPIFGLNFDDLRQRHRERKAKAAIRLSILIAGLAVAFSGVCGISALLLKQQNDLISSQNEEITKINSEIEEQSQIISEHNEELIYNQALTLAKESEALMDAGDRYGAIEKAYAALTEYDGNSMPYTEEANRSLCYALGCYNSGSIASVVRTLPTYGEVLDLKLSPGMDRIMIIDGSGSLFVYDMDKLNLLYEANDVDVSIQIPEKSIFLDNDTIGYFNINSVFTIVSLNAGVREMIDLDGSSVTMAYSDQNSYFAVSDYQTVDIYNSSDYSFIASYGDEDFGDSISGVYFSDDDKCVVFNANYFDCEGDIGLIDLSSGEEVVKIDYPFSSAYHCIIEDGKIYARLVEVGDMLSSQAYVVCFDANTLEEIWKTKIFYAQVQDMSFYNGHVILNNGRSFQILNAEDGSEEFLNVIDGNCVNYFASNQYISLYMGDGSVSMIDIADMAELDMSFSFINDRDINLLKFSSYGYIGTKESSLGAIVYKKMLPAGYTVTDDEDPEDLEYEYILDQNAKDEAQNLGVEKYYLVSRISYIPDTNYIILNYSDKTLDIYDTKKKCITDHINNMYYIYSYKGVDANGNHHFSGAYMGIVINSKGKIELVIPEYCGLSEDGKQIMSIGPYGDSERAYLPIFTTEQMLRMAETVLEEH